MLSRVVNHRLMLSSTTIRRVGSSFVRLPRSGTISVETSSRFGGKNSNIAAAVSRRVKSTTSTTTSAEKAIVEQVSKKDGFIKMMNSPRDWFQQAQGLTASQLIGRSAFLCSLAAFAVSDMFTLRMFALCSSVFSGAFQYISRPSPQKIPIRWGLIHIAVNAYMASLLYYEHKRAENMGEELEKIYEEGKFDQLGFGRIEFLNFFAGTGKLDGDRHVPQKVFLEEGEILVLQGQINRSLYYIVDGKANVMRRGDGDPTEKEIELGIDWHTLGKKVATVKSRQFVGEMSMIDAMDQNRLSILPTGTSVVAAEGGCTVYEWKIIDLRRFMWTNRQVTNALQAYVCHDLRRKLRAQNRRLKRFESVDDTVNGEKLLTSVAVPKMSRSMSTTIEDRLAITVGQNRSIEEVEDNFSVDIDDLTVEDPEDK